MDQNFNLGLPELECFRCGRCCSKYQPQLSLEEARLLAQKLALTWHEFVDRCTDPRWPGTASFLIRHDANGCLFLNGPVSGKQYLCKIHAFKPQCCLDWEFGPEKPECREGLKVRWNLDLDAAGAISGPPAVLKEFADCLKSLHNPV